MEAKNFDQALKTVGNLLAHSKELEESLKPMHKFIDENRDSIDEKYIKHYDESMENLKDAQKQRDAIIDKLKNIQI